MEHAQLQKITMGAALAGILVALASGRLPRWLRVALVFAVIVLAGGAGLFLYRYTTKPVTLTVAAGSIDGDAAKIMSAIATRLASTNSTVRLKILDKGTALESIKAFAAGEVDLAIARSDLGDLSAARTVVLVTYVVVLLVTPPGSSIEGIDDLKGKTVGVVGGEVNHRVVQMLTKGYDLDHAKVTFKDIALADTPQAVKSRQVQALLVVMPMSEKYLSMLRDFFPRNGKKQLGLIAIEAAGAIASVAKAYESYDLPKGTIRGSPAIPDDDLTTLQIPSYLVANKKVAEDTVTALTKAIMDTRRDLVGEYPVLSQIAAPSTDKDAYIPIHPGAATYFDGDQKTFFDKYGDQFFYGSMLIGSLTSLFAGAWKFMSRHEEKPEEKPLARLCALTDRVAQTRSETDLADIETSIDDILNAELPRCATGEAESGEMAALGLATHRLHHLIDRRRASFVANPSPAGST